MANTSDTARSMASRKEAGRGDPPAELLKPILEYDDTALKSFQVTIIAHWNGGDVPQKWKNATHCGITAQKEGPDRVRELQGHLPRGPRRLSTPQDNRTPPENILRGRRETAMRATRPSAATLDHCHT